MFFQVCSLHMMCKISHHTIINKKKKKGKFIGEEISQFIGHILNYKVIKLPVCGLYLNS